MGWGRRNLDGLSEGGLGDQGGRLGLESPVPALGELRPPPLLTLPSRLSQVPERIEREAPTKEERRCHPGAAAGRGAGGGAQS